MSTLEPTIDIPPAAPDVRKAEIELTRLQLARDQAEEATMLLRAHALDACDCEKCTRTLIGKLRHLFLGTTALFLVAITVACGGTFGRSASPLGTAITVTSSADAIAADGNCTLREAFRAAMTNAAVDACPAGRARPNQDQILVPPGTYTLSIAGAGENASLTGDLDIVETVAVLGTSTSAWSTIDGGGIDRIFHLTGNAGAVEIAYLVLQHGCPNGPSAAGNCRQTVNGSAPVGAAFYDNSNAALYAHDLLIRDSEAQSGGGFGICAAVVKTATIARVEVTNCTAWAGGGAAAADHVSFGWHDSHVHHNHLLGGGRGTIRQYGNTIPSRAALFNVVVEDNDEGVEVDRGGAPNAATKLTMVGGALRRNVSTASGANARAAGGTIALVDVEVRDGTADLPAWPAGSGGNLACDADGSYACRVEIRGTTSVSGGIDLSSSPSSAPDCYGQVDAYDSATVSNLYGCTVVQH